MGMGKKRSYTDTGFSSDNNGSGFGPPPNSYMKTEFGQEDYGYGGPWPDYDMNYGPPHKTRHEAPRDNEEEMLSSMGLPTSFTASIDQSMENFAEGEDFRIEVEADIRIEEEVEDLTIEEEE